MSNWSTEYRIHLTDNNREAAIEVANKEEICYEIDGNLMTVYDTEYWVSLILETIAV